VAEFISMIAATFVTVPLAGYLIVFIFSKHLTKNHRRSVHRAIDFSTLLFIISVHFLIMIICEKSFLWLIMLILVILALTFVVIHWKYRQEVDFLRVFRGYWRFNFLLFSLAYLVLIVLGLFQRVFWQVAGL
jgi:hypothetical protein